MVRPFRVPAYGENGAGKRALLASAEIRILNLAVNAEWMPVARLQWRR
jgi:hypothetical protein